ncbi:hypothetical protein HS961_16850 [Comamonas piscis]|uniref:Uncharacterized protein n=1 Tax=Comamonas piscis TaxID=1562974 RepID=A0A7G5EK43_9BURK|nr:hypothetical protein [Comamonas piscis]QMV74368.1 hypothetical protein HS961_16850 [Comamonas piscis]WSO32815.1 hypothetical protein VUJ63_16895 [Comamonas piscis]
MVCIDGSLPELGFVRRLRNAETAELSGGGAESEQTGWPAVQQPGQPRRELAKTCLAIGSEACLLCAVLVDVAEQAR